MNAFLGNSCRRQYFDVTRLHEIQDFTVKGLWLCIKLCDNTAQCSLPVVGQHRGVLEVCTTAAPVKYKDAYKHREGSLDPLVPGNTGEASVQSHIPTGDPDFLETNGKKQWKERTLEGAFPTQNDRLDVAQSWPHKA